MIVWLASYPRSGNTLLRTVLHQTLGCETYSDEFGDEVRRRIGFSEKVERGFGHRDLPGPWEDFYAQASASAQPYFVKTHRPPRDAQRALYVVRDGRRALVSYAKFHQRFLSGQPAGLLELVVGDDYYGGWSQHHRAWLSRGDAPTLVIRYEELSDASDELLGRIADFIGSGSRPRSWTNPFDAMHADNPGFFEAGKREWDGDSDWTPFVDAVFFRVHAALMAQLGYARPEAIRLAAERLTEGERVLVDLAALLAERKRALAGICDERLAVIERLDRACNERLALIESLSSAVPRGAE